MSEVKITEAETPNLFKFMQSAGAFGAQAAFGDGTLLASLMKLLEMLIPLITTMGCFASKPAFLRGVQNPTAWQMFSLHREALQLARSLPDLSWRAERQLAHEAVNVAMSTVESMTENELSACYDELSSVAA
jgi:hypothetical protein